MNAYHLADQFSGSRRWIQVLPSFSAANDRDHGVGMAFTQLAARRILSIDRQVRLADTETLGEFY